MVYDRKSIINEPKVLTLNSYKHENKLELFFQTSAKIVLLNSRFHGSYRNSG